MATKRDSSSRKDTAAKREPAAKKEPASKREPTVKREPIRRNDVIRCEKCGEDYSVTYKRCPFCDEKPVKGGSKPIRSGRRVAGGPRGAAYSGSRRVNPLQLVGLVLSLVLIIAALYIVFNAVAPLLSHDKSQGSQSQSTSVSQSAPGSSASSSGDLSQSEPAPVVNVTSISLDKTDFTLRANESSRITATVNPADAPITWTSSDESAALVGEDGTVVNVNTGSAQVKVTITATAGDKSAQCTVYCRPGSSGSATPSGSGSTGVVSNAENGLNVRSGPGSENPAIASLSNGTAITILEDTGTGWYKISFVGAGGRATEGYVSKDYVTVS